MKRISVYLTFLAAIPFATIGNEVEARKLVESSEIASQRAALGAQALINYLSSDAKKLKMSAKDVPIKQSSKTCLSKQQNQIEFGKCGTNLRVPESKDYGSQKTSTQLLIFVSSSMPLQSIKVLGQEAYKIGAKIVFRGLIGGNFKETQSYTQELGISAEIDPTKFEDYQIAQVPTFLLVHNKVIDRVVGHVSIWEALEQFKRKGELKGEGKKLYDQLKQGTVHGVNS